MHVALFASAAAANACLTASLVVLLELQSMYMHYITIPYSKIPSHACRKDYVLSSCAALTMVDLQCIYC